MVFTQIFVSYESVQYKRSAFTFLFNGSLYGKKLTSAYIELCVTGKRYHSIELADSFLLKYRLLQTSQLALYERSFERPASLSKKIPVESQVCGSASEELKV